MSDVFSYVICVDVFGYVLMFQKVTSGMVLTPSLSLQLALVPMLWPKSVASWRSNAQHLSI